MMDIAVAGGGPAGSACAALLARGHDVVVLEEHRRVGLPVQCAGLVTDGAIKLSGVSPGILSTLHGAEVVMPGGATVRVRSDEPKARAIDRAEFDSLMADRALAAGAEYRTGERLESFRVSDRVEMSTTSGGLESRLLVGADGHSSATASALGFRPEEYVRGVQADVAVRMDDQESFTIRMGSRYAPGFFTWEIPCGDCTRVGLCTSWSAGPPHQYLRRLLSDNGWEDRVVGMHCGKIPLGAMPRISSDRVMLVGDAAAQVKPVSGGGIYPSMLAAPVLADVAARALDSDDLSGRALSEYDRRWKAAFGRDIRRGMMFRRALLRMDDSDLDRAGRYASRDDVRAVIDGIEIDRPTNVVGTLLRHPRTASAGVWTLLRCLI